MSETTSKKKPVQADNLNDCSRPACDDIKDMFAKASKALASSKTSGSEVSREGRVAKSTGIECPPDSASIGRGSWTLLHSMVRFVLDNLLESRAFSRSANTIPESILSRCFLKLLQFQVAWYPDNPGEDDKRMIKNFFDALARFYPCTYCAHDFSKNLREKPLP